MHNSSQSNCNINLNMNQGFDIYDSDINCIHERLDYNFPYNNEFSYYSKLKKEERYEFGSNYNLSDDELLE